MSRLADDLRDLKRSRFFLPGVGLGVLLGFGLSAAWFQTTLPQWRPTGSAAARTVVRPPAAPGAPIRLKPGAVIVCEGDSLTYGFKRWGESIPGINGSPSPRSPTPYPETLRGLLGDKVTVVNHGKPGDQTLDGLTRWAREPTGDLTIIMYGANDAKVRGKPGALDVKVYASLLEALVRRRLDDGGQVIVLLPPPASARETQPRLDPFREAAVQVAARTGVKAVDAAQALAGIGAPLQYDGLHLNDQANLAIARALAEQIRVE
ncbi:hypothetical protein AS593_08715 [Caulobacter vibrioides]|nr:hypothetical protein AS593_08715 [Caulobacter vibrioides]